MTGACLAALWAVDAARSRCSPPGRCVLIYRALWVPLLEHKSRTDPKTGLYNSEYLAVELEDALRRAPARGSGPLGRDDRPRPAAAGQQPPRPPRRRRADPAPSPTSSPQAAERHDGIAARFGGEELCVLLPERARSSAAREIAEEVRARGRRDQVRVRRAPSEPLGDDRQRRRRLLPRARRHRRGPARRRRRRRLRRQARRAQPRPDRARRRRARGARASSPPAPAAPAPAPRAVPAEPAGSASNGRRRPADGRAPEPPPRSAGPRPTRPSGREPCDRRSTSALLCAAAAGRRRALQPRRDLADAVAVRARWSPRSSCSTRSGSTSSSAPTSRPPRSPSSRSPSSSARSARSPPRRVIALDPRRPPRPGRSSGRFDFGALSLAGAAAALRLRRRSRGADGALLAGRRGARRASPTTPSTRRCWRSSWASPRAAARSRVWRERLAWLAPHYLAFGLLAGTFVIAELEPRPLRVRRLRPAGR